MTPADQSLFITLWQQGASQQELATRLGVPIGTIKSRASALARQGKIQPRPKGDAYPRQRHQAAMAPVQTPVQITALPPYPKGKAVRWNLWILDAIRDELASLATERGVSPSQLVQELLWKALTDQSSSTP
jgi:transposase